MKWPEFSACRFSITCGLTIILLAVLPLGAQQASSESGGSAAQESAASSALQGVYLVFPFENAGASPSLDWLGEGFEELTIQRLAAAGEQVYSHEGRTEELDRAGFPPTAKLSRASMLRIAQNMDADFVIFGRFTSDGKTLTVEGRVLRLSPIRMLPAVRETGPLDSLMELQLKLLWNLLRENDPSYHQAQEEFSRAQRPLRLDAFEHYVRGLRANDDDARLRDLREAARLEPEWPDPDYAIGDVYYARRDCNSALPWFARIPRTHDRYPEAIFETGVCHLLMNQSEQAETAFTALQDFLRGRVSNGTDLPEILNDLALARAREGKLTPAITDLQRAADEDPEADDYSFNLGLLSYAAKDYSKAADYFRDASGREPDNPDNRAMLILSLEKSGNQTEADEERDTASETFGPDALPTMHLDGGKDALAKLERVRTELDTTALRLDIVSAQASASASSPSAAADTPASHVRRGRIDLAAGRVDDAEKEFRAALATDAKVASAHSGLAEVFRRRGKLDDSAQELQNALQIRDSAVVRTALARIYIAQKKPDQARAEVERALKLAPKYPEAKLLLDNLQKGKPSGVPQ
ncbi:MAG TPA: tetratricopeptide repeat protein [Candidatus Acidoferrum sp.]|nr:tetratricopeptide repeat protein [Candidatus Acidoferrum sp.]